MEIFLEGDSLRYWGIGMTGPKEGFTRVGWGYPNDQRIGAFGIKDLFGEEKIESICVYAMRKTA